LAGQKVVLRVTAESDGVYDKSQLNFDAGNIEILEPLKVTIPGRLEIKGFGESAVYRGDMVQVEGKLFLARGSHQARVSFADLKVLGRSNSPVESLRLRFLAGMQNALPEPLASFGLGLLIGQRTTLPEQVTKDLAIVGLTHIIAVSGYNLTIIIRAARQQLGKSSKYQGLVLSLVLIGLFLLVTGFSASIVRAAIVSTLSLVAWYYGRTFRPILLLAIAAAITAGWYPLYLWSDIGWFLSFLAFYGVLVLAPMIMRRVYKGREPNSLTLVVIESICAQIMTAPFILFIFNQVSLIGLIGNVLIVPLVPLAMLLSLFAGLTGMLVPVIAGWIAWPAQILLTYMLDLVHVMARWPHALLQRSLPLVSMLALYVALVLVSFILWHKTFKTVTVTDEETGILEEF
jgi:competence protein ComEC